MPVQRKSENQPQEVQAGVYRRIMYTDKLMATEMHFTLGPWKEPLPPHSHPHEQVSYLASGEVIFFCENEPDQHLKPGDMFAVPSGKIHTVKLISDEAVLIDSFTPIREDFL